MSNYNINKYLTKNDLIDYYITKNINKIIKNKQELKFIKENIFLLSINNSNNKNSLIILLELGKFEVIKNLIESNYYILDFKNTNENNLLKILLAYEYFYDYINELINKLDYDFIIKLLTYLNNSNNNFIDNIILLLNLNINILENNLNIINGKLIFINKNTKNKIVYKIIKIIKSIYLLDNEKNTLIITKLCKNINNSDILLILLNYLNIQNFDLYPDLNMMTCIDYLLLNENIQILNYFINIINYIYFINIDNNIIFNLWDMPNIDSKVKLEILFKILKKSNITNIKNNKNQNIFFKIISTYKIDPKILANNINLFNIYEQDIDGVSLYDIISNIYTKNEIKIILEHNLNKKNNFRELSIINFKNILIKSDIGIFSSNIIHNMIYTINLLFKYANLSIPYIIQSIESKKKQIELLNISNNEKNMINYLKSYCNNFNNWIPHLILWKNKFNYWIDPNLITWLKSNSDKEYVYIKLSVYLLENINTRHSNVIFIDNIR